jgi:hypothetical protein
MLSVLKVTQRGPPTCTITTLPAASDGGVGPRFAHLAPLRRGLVGKKPHIAWVAPRVGGAGAELTRATHRAWLYSSWYLPASQPKHSTTESKWPRANPGTQAWHPSPAHPDGQSRQNVAPPESQIQKSVSLDSCSSFVLTPTIQIQKYTYTRIHSTVNVIRACIWS